MTVDPGLAGERKNVTAVFIDLVAFSTISSTADAEDLHHWLEDYYRQARAIFDVSGGEITEYLGDGIVAIFGLGRADELSAGRAVDAALQAVTAIRLSHPGHGPVALRAGIATGDVVARAPAERDGLPRITGGVTTLAQRLQSLAEPGTVIIADETLRLLRGAFETKPLGAQTLKGFATPLPLHHVIRRRPIAPFTNPEIFVGRAAETALLEQATEPVLIVGEAGIGKTALVAQIARNAPEKTLFQADAIKRGASYQPFRDWALNCIADATPDDAALAATFPGLSETDLRAIALVLGLPSGQILIATLSNLALKSVIEAAIWRAIRARQPSGLLLFEDLHWFDVASFGVLTHIFASPDAARYRIILTSREDTKLGQHLTDPAPRIIGLRGLPPEDSTRLLDTFSQGTLAPATRQLILDRAGGVPLFIEHLGLRGTTTNIPATLMDLLGERIDASGTAKPILQRAAALGRTFRLDLLRALQPDATDPEP
ncbi:MAG: adenylate/guanylate cyclase domain-containing protein, partial [Paracoccaceae bacterium]